MEGFKIAAFALILWGFQFCIVKGDSCTSVITASGKIFSDGNFNTPAVCWKFQVPSGYFLHLNLISLISNRSCDDVYVTISSTKAFATRKFCGMLQKDRHNRLPVDALGNVTVTYFIRHFGIVSSFELEYHVMNSECMNNDKLRCDINTCIPEDQVCDGVKDCRSGADEIGCETRIPSIEGVNKTIQNAAFWLKNNITTLWGWRENTPRAIVALYLAAAAHFNGTDLQEELMAQQNQVRTAVALLRPSLTINELSMFINALLVTCHNPRHFYGNDLVKRLKEQVEESGNFTHPLAYLALCNANETWPLKATFDLNSILNSGSEYPFVKDLQAMAVLALKCKRKRGDENGLKNTTSTLVTKIVQHFKQLQTDDDSFGNIHTTALITQALLSSGQEHIKNWKLNATIKYLMNELNSSVDFLATCLTLPILNGKTLVDISSINCSANPRKHLDDPLSEMNDYSGPKIRVQYSLFIGDGKDVVYTISLRVPGNYTAAQIMEFAELENPKYKFEWKMTSGKMYVYKMANIINDPEAGKFWLLYVGSTNQSESLIHFTKGPNEIVMGDGEHLVFWYKTATI